jgi:hypothetical protein
MEIGRGVVTPLTEKHFSKLTLLFDDTAIQNHIGLLSEPPEIQNYPKFYNTIIVRGAVCYIQEQEDAVRLNLGSTSTI